MTNIMPLFDLRHTSFPRPDSSSIGARHRGLGAFPGSHPILARIAARAPLGRMLGSRRTAMTWTPKDKVVVPVDFSKESFAAVDEALDLVADPSHVFVIHVLPQIVPNDTAMTWPVATEQSAREDLTHALHDKLKDPKYEGYHVAVEFGSPGAQIALFAQRIGADMIVLPSHGRTGLKRLLLGSVAEQVVRLAHCPVLVLRNGGAK
jgi:nucleotide-binding universal stress UspA family protein